MGKYFLEKSGVFSVTVVDNAEDALFLLREQHFDAIVSDYQMSRMDGISLLQYLREMDSQTPFIILTGRGREEVVIDALNSGADFYIQKGGSPAALFAELSRKIEYAIQRKQAEAALWRSTEIFRTLVEQSYEGIIIVDYNGRILFANPRASAIIESDPGIDTNDNINALDFIIPPAERERAVSALAGVRNENEPYYLQYRIKTLRGNELVVECIGNEIEFGTRPAVLLSIRDITGQIEAETAIKESEKRLRAIFKHTPVSLILVSLEDGVFVDVNDMFEESFGYSRDEVIGKTVEEPGLLVADEKWDAFYSKLREERVVRGMELRFRKKSGEIGICRISSNFITIENRPCILSSVEDITDITDITNTRASDSG
ncbi:PAS domain S-box protein [Methanocalculus sp. MSAO_Arc1]|uniref:PAS domain S-box protein n=1 Tax=Methanocalculus sp. MSAO_Arc1 TaxID=2293854 RepID=UPI0025ED16DA|nr:PAS domain S-box protein [Methanocalculus sp. MSAO_Arc1]